MVIDVNLWPGPAITAIALAAVLGPATVIDIRTRRIPDVLTFALAIVLVGLRVAFGPDLVWWTVLETAAAAGFLLLLRVGSRGGLGLGDVKLGVALMLGLGAVRWALGLFLASGTGAVVGLLLIRGGTWSRSTRIPFVPFLAAGMISAALIADHVVAWFTNLIAW